MVARIRESLRSRSRNPLLGLLVVAPWLVACGRSAERLIGIKREVDLSTDLGAREPLTVLVVADRDLPWSALRPIVTTAAEVGYRVELVVLADDRVAPLRSVVVHDGHEAIPADDATTLQALVDARAPGPPGASPLPRVP